MWLSVKTIEANGNTDVVSTTSKSFSLYWEFLCPLWVIYHKMVFTDNHTTVWTVLKHWRNTYNIWTLWYTETLAAFKNSFRPIHIAGGWLIFRNICGPVFVFLFFCQSFQIIFRQRNWHIKSCAVFQNFKIDLNAHFAKLPNGFFV